jgi:proline iminopeptidase
MATAVQHGRYLHCPNGSHLAMYDDFQRYARGLVDFMYEVGFADTDRGATM